MSFGINLGKRGTSDGTFVDTMNMQVCLLALHPDTPVRS